MSSRLLLVLCAASLLSACAETLDPPKPEVVQVGGVSLGDRFSRVAQEQAEYETGAAVDERKLWRLQARWLGANGEPLRSEQLELVQALADWPVGEAPVGPSAGFELLGFPGEIGSARQTREILAEWALHPQRVILLPPNARVASAQRGPRAAWVAVVAQAPGGANALELRLTGVCGIEQRRMRMDRWMNGDGLIAWRKKAGEPYRWREARLSEGCAR